MLAWSIAQMIAVGTVTAVIRHTQDRTDKHTTNFTGHDYNLCSVI